MKRNIPYWFAVSATVAAVFLTAFAIRVSAAGCNPFLVASGGTSGCSFSKNSILTGGTTATGALQATSSNPLYVGAIVATTSVASSFAGAVTVSGNLTTNVTGTNNNCLQANTSGVVSGTGSSCSGGSSFGEAWQLFNSKAYLAPTTTVGIIVAASSTILGNFTITGNSTTTNATTTSIATTLASSTNTYLGTGTCSGAAGNALTTTSSGLVGCSQITQANAVTAISIATNQGVSGSSSGGTTPALTINLGALTGVTSVNGLIITANTGVITTGTWNGTTIAIANGGTGTTTPGVTNAVEYYDGSTLTNDSTFIHLKKAATGVGTTTPTSQFAVSTSSASAPTTPLFTVASSTNATIITTLGSGASGIGTTTPVAALTLDRNGAVASSTIAVYEYIYGTATTTTETVNCNSSTQSHIRIGTAGVTVTLTGMIAGQTCRVIIENPNSGTPGTVTWAVATGYLGVFWPGGTAPTGTATVNKQDVYSFIATQASSTVDILGASSLNF